MQPDDPKRAGELDARAMLAKSRRNRPVRRRVRSRRRKPPAGSAPSFHPATEDRGSSRPARAAYAGGAMPSAAHRRAGENDHRYAARRRIRERDAECIADDAERVATVTDDRSAKKRVVTLRRRAHRLRLPRKRSPPRLDGIIRTSGEMAEWSKAPDSKLGPVSKG